MRKILISIITLCAIWVGYTQVLYAAPKSHYYTNAHATMNITALSDDIIHVDFQSGKHPAKNSIAVSSFVQKTNYNGPSTYHVLPNGFQTKDIKVVVYQQSLCIRLYDLQEKINLTKICPHGLDHQIKSIRIDPSGLTHAYGLGQHFTAPGQINGDLVTHQSRDSGLFGNVLENFDQGTVGNVQVPVIYGLGKGKKNFGLYLDNQYKQKWVFSKKAWRGQVHGGNSIRFFFMTGPNLRDLRADYMEITGKPPVPPKKMFGLWVSDNGIQSWSELDAIKSKLVSENFPLDGFVLDNHWSGGWKKNATDTNMGRFSWDRVKFPKPKEKISTLQSENLGLMVVEYPYVGLDLYRTQKNFHKYMVKDNQGKPVLLDYQSWWGIGSMLDYTNPKVSSAWFDWKRMPLIEDGVSGFWTDLGEPEQYVEDIALYHGGKNHEQVHNEYNFFWSQSLYEGYQRNGLKQRPFILSRSGGPGSQRYGVALRSGNIAAKSSSLSAHYNTQMHMSLSGFDYYGSDVGGFWRHVGPEESSDRYKKLYSLWLANAVWTDVPIRPHAYNLENKYKTSPALVGSTQANKANLMLRYELLPYYYSLAYHAHLKADPIVAPLVVDFQDDMNLRQVGSQKMIGPWIMIAHVTDPSQEKVSVYFPKGAWLNYHTKTWISNDQPSKVTLSVGDGKGGTKLPAYIRQGAIIPRYIYPKKSNHIHVDAAEKLEWLILPSTKSTEFVAYDDDGKTTAYQNEKFTSTKVTQVKKDNIITVTFMPQNNQYKSQRQSQHVHLMMEGIKGFKKVHLNGKALDRKAVKFSSSDQAQIDLSRNSIDEKIVLTLTKEK